MADISHAEQLKHVGDAGAVAITVGTLADLLPAVAATLTIVWTLIRIYETQTVQSLLGRVKDG